MPKRVGGEESSGPLRIHLGRFVGGVTRGVAVVVGVGAAGDVEGGGGSL